MFTYRKRYFFITLALFILEVLIALYVNDSFVRPYLGDVIVVILIYCFFRTFLNASKKTIAIATLLFAVGIEVGQAFNLIEILGLEDNTLAKIVLGTSFSWEDIAAYHIGVLLVYTLDNKEIK